MDRQSWIASSLLGIVVAISITNLMLGMLSIDLARIADALDPPTKTVQAD